MNPHKFDRELELARWLEQSTGNDAPWEPTEDGSANLELTADESLELSQAAECLSLLNELVVTLAIPDVTSSDADHNPLLPQPSSLPWGSLPAQIGKYRVLEMAGRGGFAAVFRARDLELHRDVALKIPLPGRLQTPTDLQRFVREGRAAARLQHPAIVPVFAAGREQDVSYLALAWCPGPTLQELLQERHAPLSPTQAVRITVRIAEAIAHAHEQGIVHRDLKSANILVPAESLEATNDSDHWCDQIVVTDFGLARHLGDSGDRLTHSDAMLGTPAWMPPEQITGRQTVTVGGDIWGLGLILYELLTNTQPFRRNHQAATMQAIVEERPPTLAEIRPELDRTLSAICQKCLEKLPEDRYLSAQELLADLRSYLVGEKVQVVPISPWGRGIRWARRRPLVAASVVGALLSLAGATVVSLQFAWQANVNWQHAEQVANQLRYSLRREQVALAAERDARQRVLIESDKQKTQYEFLLDIFRKLDPSRAGSAHISARELLQQARVDALRRFGDDPQQHAEVLSGIARSMNGVGMCVESADCRRLSWQLLERCAGTTDPKTMQALDQLARAEMQAGRIRESLEARQELLSRLKAVYADDSAPVLKAELQHGFALLQAGDVEEVKILLDELPEHTDTHLLDVFLLRQQGYLSQALALTEEEIATLKEVLGEWHPRTLWSLGFFAALLKEAGELERSLAVAVEMLELAQRHRGVDSLIALQATAFQADVLNELRRHAEAAELVQATRELAEARYGTEHREVLRLMWLDALTRWRQGHRTEACEILARQLPICQTSLGNDHPLTQKMIKSLGTWRIELGQTAAALEVLEPAWLLLANRPGNLGLTARGIATRTAGAWQATGQASKSAQLYQRILAEVVEQEGVTSETAQDLRMTAAHASFQSRDYDTAHRLIADFLEQCEAAGTGERKRWVAAAGLKAFILRELEEPQAAAEWAQRVLKSPELKPPWNSLMYSLTASLGSAQGLHARAQVQQPTTLIALRDRCFNPANFNERWLIRYCAEQFLQDQRQYSEAPSDWEAAEKLLNSFPQVLVEANPPK